MRYKMDTDDAASSLEGWAFLLFHSQWPCYAFADQLNQLYDYRLTRIDDMLIDDIQWPFFTHADTVGHTHFFLAERPLNAKGAPWEPGDKLLAIKGDNAGQVAQFIHKDFTSESRIDDGDLLASEHAMQMGLLLADFTVASLIDFDATELSRKAQRELASTELFCERILAYIEGHHLDLGEAERMRIIMQHEKK